MRSAAAAAAVCLAAAIPYLPTLDDYFVQDDFGVVWLLSQKPWSYFPRWFASTWMDDIWGYTPDEIRPFPAITYQMTARWGAGSPLPDHALNIAIHALNGLLVLAVAQRLARLSLAAATFAALVFVLLPIQAESVAWVTGRVDSMPAFFYLGAFVLYGIWRQAGGRGRYLGSVVLFFVALFTKQNAITLGPALVLYDLVVGRQPLRPTWTSLRPYVPFVALTLGYLALRYALFGEVARESQLTASGLEYFASLVVRHLHRTIFGAPDPVAPLLWALAAALVAVVAWIAPRLTLFFGPIWWGLGVAPVLVAAYESPRHIYLASVGWAVLLGCALDAAWASARGRRALRPIVGVAATAVLAVYASQLVRVVEDWGVRAGVSQRAAQDLAREAAAVPAGTLIVAVAPAASWEWALPFVLRPPFADAPLDQRVEVVMPQALWCCRSQWERATRDTLRRWLAQPPGAPVVALRWHPRTGALARLTDREEPYLPALLQVVAETDDAAALDRALVNILPPP